MRCLIDGDILVYRVGFASQDVEFHYAAARMRKMIDEICTANDTRDYTVFLTSDDKSNFRFELFPEYKANRKAPKPLWYGDLRAYLVSDHKAVVVHGREADDALADEQMSQQPGSTVICTIDKDLDQVPGLHYDFVKGVHYDVDQARAIRFFYFQLLTGDRTDNIPGLPGIGPAKAGKILQGCPPTEPELFARVRKAYQDTFKERADELMLLYGRLLKIGGNVWEFPEVTEVKDSEVTSNVLSLPSLSDTNLDSNTNPASSSTYNPNPLEPTSLTS